MSRSLTGKSTRVLSLVLRRPTLIQNKSDINPIQYTSVHKVLNHLNCWKQSRIHRAITCLKRLRWMTNTSGSDHSPMVFVAPFCCLWQCGHSHASSPLSWRITFHESNMHEKIPNQWEHYCKLVLFQFWPVIVVVASNTSNSPLLCIIKYKIYNYNHRNIIHVHVLIV